MNKQPTFHLGHGMFEVHVNIEFNSVILKWGKQMNE